MCINRLATNKADNRDWLISTSIEPEIERFNPLGDKNFELFFAVLNLVEIDKGKITTGSLARAQNVIEIICNYSDNRLYRRAVSSR